jgi:GWxTD domain-containing protein
MNWLDQDVRWIITDEERSAFKQMRTDEEREQFIEAFWQRRNPEPRTIRNEFKQEHYRRFLFANEQFAAFEPGWRTDRGRFYIWYGPPDDIQFHATGGTYSLSGPPLSNLPYEAWHYRYVEGLGDITLNFADICGCGDWHLIEGKESDRSPSAYDLYEVVTRHESPAPSSNQEPTIQKGVGLSMPPQVRLRNLEEVVTHKVIFTSLPFSVRSDFVKATDYTTVVPITVSVPNQSLKFGNKNEIQRATLNLFGRVTDASSGRVAATFEDTVQVDVSPDVFSRKCLQIRRSMGHRLR